jgi:hypothetical protein
MSSSPSYVSRCASTRDVMSYPRSRYSSRPFRRELPVGYHDISRKEDVLSDLVDDRRMEKER